VLVASQYPMPNYLGGDGRALEMKYPRRRLRDTLRMHATRIATRR